MNSKPAQTTALDNGVLAIDAEHIRPLFDSSHLINEDGRAAFVDTGANESVPLLIDSLRQQDLDVADVDFVFLTHIHLDHAGGAGALMKLLPNAQCVVHPRGAPHMIDPAKLIAGAEAVYGAERTQRMYGTIEPIDTSRVVVPDDEQWFELNGRALQTVFTEGHARHHYCLNDPASRGVFTGDSFGVSYRELDTAAGEFVYPSTSPAGFDPDEAHKSVDRIVNLGPEFLYLTHFSRVGSIERLAADMHSCIDAFVHIALNNREAADPVVAIEADMFDVLRSRLHDHGYRGDDEALRSVIGLDTQINSQGLAVWLQRVARAG